METLKRPPPGVDKAHPRVEVLKRKGPELKDWLLAQARVAAPLVKWGFAYGL